MRVCLCINKKTPSIIKKKESPLCTFYKPFSSFFFSKSFSLVETQFEKNEGERERERRTKKSQSKKQLEKTSHFYGTLDQSLMYWTLNDITTTPFPRFFFSVIFSVVVVGTFPRRKKKSKKAILPFLWFWKSKICSTSDMNYVFEERAFSVPVYKKF